MVFVWIHDKLIIWQINSTEKLTKKHNFRKLIPYNNFSIKTSLFLNFFLFIATYMLDDSGGVGCGVHGGEDEPHGGGDQDTRVPRHQPPAQHPHHGRR